MTEQQHKQKPRRRKGISNSGLRKIALFCTYERQRRGIK